MYLTAQDYIKMSLRTLGLYASGESISDDEMQDNLQSLNIMLNSWAADKLIHQAHIKESFTLSAASGVYTIGQDQTFNTVKPMTIELAKITDNNSDYPVYIKSLEYFESIANKSLTGRPYILYYDPGISQPYGEIGKIYLYPKRDKEYSLTIYSVKPFREFTSLTHQIDIPQYFVKAIKYNLCIEIAPEYGKKVPAEIIKSAEDGMKILKRMTAKNYDIVFDFNVKGAGGTYNIYSDI